MTAVYHRNGVCTKHLVERTSYCRGEIHIIGGHDIVYQLHQHLGIGLALKLITALTQLVTQCSIVLYYTIVYQRKVTRLAYVRMCIHLARYAVSSPPCMGNANGSCYILTLCRSLKVRHLSFCLIYVKLIPVIRKKSTTCGIISTVLQSFQPLNKDRISLLCSYVSNYTTHEVFFI